MFRLSQTNNPVAVQGHGRSHGGEMGTGKPLLSIGPRAYPKSFVRGVQLDKFLERRDDPIKYHYKRAIIGPPAKRH